MFKCKICKIDKDEQKDYYQKNNKRNGRICKICLIENSKKYRTSNLEVYKKRARTYMKTYKYPNDNSNMKTCSKCKIEKPVSNFYFDKQKGIYQSYCKDCKKPYSKLYYKNNLIKIRNYKGLWRQKIQNKIRCNLSTRIRNVVKKQNTNKNDETEKLVGCDMDFLLIWIQFQFDVYMSFDNYGKYWHIDHYIPCSSFNLVDEQEQKKCFHWTNLRPLEKIQNMKKSNSFLKNTSLFIELKMHLFYKSKYF